MKIQQGAIYQKFWRKKEVRVNDIIITKIEKTLEINYLHEIFNYVVSFKIIFEIKYTLILFFYFPKSF